MLVRVTDAFALVGLRLLVTSDACGDFADKLLEWIKSHEGKCPFGDKSAPDDIKRTFQVS